MTAKEYLQQAYRIEQRRRAKWAQIEALSSIAEHSTSCLNALRVGGTDRRSKIELAVDKIIEVEDEVSGIAEELTAKLREIAAVIDRVEDRRQHSVLSYRYLSFWPWDRIAAELHYEPAWVFKLHRWALQEVEKVLKLDSKR